MGIWKKPKAEHHPSPQLAQGLAEAADAIRRLSFELPEMLRKAWVSETARNFHEPRIKAAAEAWRVVEQRSAGRVRPCALIIVDTDGFQSCLQEIEGAGQSPQALRVEDVAAPGAGGPRLITHIAAGRPGDVRAFRKAWIAGDGDAMGALLGYPSCCRVFFNEVFSRRGFRDPTWLMARATPGARVEGNVVSVSGPCETNVALRRMGVRAVPHLPCSFGCEASAELGRAITDLAVESGHGEGVNRLLEILDWNVAWSARHGVAEIRTPVLKLSTQTDATAESYILNRAGGAVPEFAARGLGFPYLSPGPRAARH